MFLKLRKKGYFILNVLCGANNGSMESLQKLPIGTFIFKPE